jgi:hypothetical protein
VTTAAHPHTLLRSGCVCGCVCTLHSVCYVLFSFKIFFLSFFWGENVKKNFFFGVPVKGFPQNFFSFLCECLFVVCVCVSVFIFIHFTSFTSFHPFFLHKYKNSSHDWFFFFFCFEQNPCVYVQKKE